MARPRLTEQQKLAKALTELHQVLGAEQGVVRGKQIKNPTRLLLLERYHTVFRQLLGVPGQLSDRAFWQ